MSLQEFQRLKVQYAQSNPQSSKYQPNESEQRRLIAKNAGDRLVSVIMKRESAKFIFHQKLKLEEEMKNELSENVDANIDANAKVEKDIVANRAPTANKKLTPKKPPRKGQKLYSVFRPGNPKQYIFSRGTRLTNIIQSQQNPDIILQELQEQGMDQYKDAKKIFEYISQSFDTGKMIQCHPRRTIEEIDLSQYNTPVSLAAVTRLEDLSQIRKRMVV